MPEALLTSSDYVSIVITSYNRPQYLEPCLNSIHSNLDMPVEIIVHEDGSSPQVQDLVYKMKDKVSTTIFNHGSNMGINTSANRAVSSARSNYILFLNDDCIFVRPFLKEMVALLNKPYVGWVAPSNEMYSLERRIYLELDTGYITSYPFESFALGFKKSTWQAIGGWAEHATTGSSDNVFLTKMLSKGYFKGLLKNGKGLDVLDPGSVGYVASYSFAKGNDCSYPKLFGYPADKLFHMNHKRREANTAWVDSQRVIVNRTDGVPNPVAGFNDWNYWGSYYKSLFSEKGIEWNQVHHGQDVWQDYIHPLRVIESKAFTGET